MTLRKLVIKLILRVLSSHWHPRPLKIRPPSQPTSTKIIIPSRPKQAHRISTTYQNLLTHILPSEPKASNSEIDSAQ
ncbi:hypothetical protein PAXRUDRAFT_17683 [Paxillus rubicundulus Ve08.2h10]|uniref:Uncharacterized protein n=1 Tax=Paxillus rubicundulus Ve08.2h10 TaxID=930991 RepID=A0A0D0CPD1_9AGAM|nr:hypothetical protein PAXRUDRAFT_17683 [Paxillus rubicundulus Ve08.2h10]